MLPQQIQGPKTNTAMTNNGKVRRQLAHPQADCVEVIAQIADCIKGMVSKPHFESADMREIADRAVKPLVLVAESVGSQLLRRIGFRRAIKKTLLTTMKAGALGVKGPKATLPRWLLLPLAVQIINEPFLTFLLSGTTTSLLMYFNSAKSSRLVVRLMLVARRTTLLDDSTSSLLA